MSITSPPKNSFTCTTCHLLFNSSDLQRQHYKTDWHRYNLKRKVAELPPVTAECFKTRAIHQKFLVARAQEDKKAYCKVCRKLYSNTTSYNYHLKSKKHKENDRDYEEPLDKTEKHEEEIEEVDSDEWDENPFDTNVCLFCSHHSRSFIKILEHMTIEHSFFIPDIEFCNDIEGLVYYLEQKVSQEFICLWCNDKGKTFHSAEAVKNHMVDKGHCKILHEGTALAEYVYFYDYSSSYPDSSKVDPDEQISIPELDDSEYQLTLPSGITVGHRSLMRYYKQSINPNSVATVAKDTKKLHKVLATYRALGWTSTQQEAAARKAKDIHYMKRMQAKLTMKLGVKGNKLQTHFRQQVNF